MHMIGVVYMVSQAFEILNMKKKIYIYYIYTHMYIVYSGYSYLYFKRLCRVLLHAYDWASVHGVTGV